MTRSTISSLVQTLTSPHHIATRTYEANRDVLASISNDLPAGKTYQHAGGVTNGPIQISAYGYVVNSLGQRTDLTRQGVAFASSHYDHVGYNATGEVTATNRFSGTTPGQGAAQTAWDQGYVFDGLGNRTASTASVGAGNITYTPDSLNEYDWVSVPGVNNSFAPIYDDDGNLLRDGWTDQTWDAENRMISRSPRWQTGNDFRWAYDYDFRGRRVKMVGELWTGSVWQHYMTETFLYDGWSGADWREATQMAKGHRAAARTSWGDVRVNIACSYAKFGTDSTWHKRSYTWGLDLSGSLQGAGGVGGLLALNGWYYPGNSGTAKWVYCYDGNGNVTQLLGTSGTHVILGAHYEYDAFGQITAAPNPWAYWTNIAWSNPFRFSTKFLSAWNRRNYEYNIAWHNMDYYWLRWYDYGYRWYDPMKGRWTSRDPIGERGGCNLYQMAGNTPVNHTDVLGLQFPAVPPEAYKPGGVYAPKPLPVTWKPKRCPRPYETSYIQVVSNISTEAQLFLLLKGLTGYTHTDDGGLGLNRGGYQPNPVTYPIADDDQGRFGDEPSTIADFEVCRACVCKGRIVSIGPCVNWNTKDCNRKPSPGSQANEKDKGTVDLEKHPEDFPLSEKPSQGFIDTIWDEHHQDLDLVNLPLVPSAIQDMFEEPNYYEYER